METLVRLENVVKFYPPRRWALNGVSLSLDSPEFVAICGGPGSGKSTLLKLIAGIEKPSEGEIWIMEHAVHRMSDSQAADFRNRNISLLMRNPSFWPSLTVLENVAMPLMIRGEREAERIRKARNWLESMGLMERCHVRPDALDAFDRQRASLARAIAAGPKLLLADEPLGDLNAEEAYRIMELLQVVVCQGGATLLYFTQNRENMKAANQIMTLCNGKLRRNDI